MNRPGHRTRAFAAWVVRHGIAIWVVALILAVPAAIRTASLYAHLKTDVEALLPRQAPSVLALHELRTRLPGLQHLGVVVDTGSAENLAAGEHFIDDLAAKIAKYPPDLVRTVRIGDAAERQFLEKNAALYVDLADLKEIRARVEARRDYEVSKGMGLSIEDDPPPPLDFGDIQKKYEDRVGHQGKGENSGRYSSAEQHVTMLLVQVGGFETGQTHSRKLLERVKADVESLGGPGHYAPGMRVGYSGDVAISVEETSALMSDLSVSSVLVVFAVIFVLAYYYRWIWSVAILLPPLLLATLYSFAIASLRPFGVTELNSNTAFLGSIIVGNGINFGIVLLARYVEERRRGTPPMDGIAVALWGARAGTLSAALAAGASYAALSVTGFQGFRQFGIIGGIGMVLSWAATQILIPPLIAWVDSKPERAPRPVRASGSPMAFVARWVTRAPVPILAASLALTALTAYRAHSFGPQSLEYDLSKLRRADTWKSGEGYWGRKMDALLGRYLTPIVVLTGSKDAATAVRARLVAATREPGFGNFIGQIRTATDVLPDEQPEKIAEATAIRRALTRRIRARLDAEQQDTVRRFVDGVPERPIALADLPEVFTTGMRERSGVIDRVVLVFPKPSHALWEGPSIERFVGALRDAATAGGTSARVAGSLPVSADILGRIEHDGPLASVLAFVGAAATVIAVFRFSSVSALVLGSLVTGVLWLLGSTLIFGVRINFANFIAFPITFGIGVDYAVNVMTRYVQDGDRDVVAAIRSTGGAVALCSATTIIGYSSLLVAENRALFLFGLVAVLGEIACLVTAVVSLPALLEAWNRRHVERYGNAE